MSKTTMVLVLIVGLVAPIYASAAEYNGVTIDGDELSCTAFSYDTGSYYDVAAEFSGDEVTITFGNGGSRTLSLDDDDIDDPSSISAYDYDNAVYWDLDCSDDLD